MRVPWLIVGTLGGIAALALLLLVASDSTGGVQSMLLFVCPLLGLGIGFLLDDLMAQRKKPPE